MKNAINLIIFSLGIISGIALYKVKEEYDNLSKDLTF